MAWARMVSDGLVCGSKAKGEGRRRERVVGTRRIEEDGSWWWCSFKRRVWHGTVVCTLGNKVVESERKGISMSWIILLIGDQSRCFGFCHQNPIQVCGSRNGR